MRVLALLLVASALQAQQVADTSFNPAVAHPSYKEGTGPLILLDEAHHNFHTVNGRYSGFTRLARKDGYRVEPNTRKFSASALEGARILVIANAINERNMGGGPKWSVPTPSAFDRTEIEAVREWVRGGGSLMLIADHMPFGGAASDLAAAFGAHFSNGFVMQKGTGATGLFVHTRRDGAIADHPITRGIDSVKIFTGQGFTIDSGAALLTITADAIVLLPDTAWRFTPTTKTEPARGLLQGAVIPFGNGRVAMFGEAAMFSAQVTGPNRSPMGMNDPGAAQNPQFLLNVLHWLSAGR